MAAKHVPGSLKWLVAGLMTASVLGCGSDEPTPVTPAKLEESKRKQLDIRRKEFGPAAGKAPKSARAAKR